MRSHWIFAWLLVAAGHSHSNVAHALLQVHNNNTGSQAAAACALLRNSLGPAIVQVSGEEYQAGISSPWNHFNTELSPTCIVFPLNTKHVQVAMRAIYATESNYAVQAGGHSGMHGWNTIQDGVLIHFLNMRNASYNPARDTITLQPGIHWAGALSAVEPYGVAPLGGRDSDVGTGLLLGGGLSFLSAAHGYSADAYKELDVVLVNGDVVTATVTNRYADLFRALKGGANRFGIITRYEVDAIHTGTKDDKTWFGGTIYWDASNADRVLKAVAHYVREVKDPKAALLVVFVDVMVQGSIVARIFSANIFYNGPSLPSSVFGEFLSIPATSSSLSPLSYFEVANLIQDLPDKTPGQTFTGSTLSGDEGLVQNAFDHWSNFTETFKDNLSMNVLALTPVLPSQILAGRRKGGNAIDAPLEGFIAVAIQTSYLPGVASAAIPKDVERGRQLLMKQIPRSPGLPLYVGECDADQNAFETYGGYEFLKRTYAKYDPTRFNVRHTKGPKGL